MQPFQSEDEVVRWIRQTSPGVKPGLERMKWLAGRLGHPERVLKGVHVAGTNGKGSTAAMIAQVLLSTGYDVGLFTSPYLENFSERIRFNGENISEADLLKAANRVCPLAEELSKTELGAPTEFEMITAIALEYFAHVRFPYYVVWETGMGGRLDSTNIIYPVVSIITTVGMDHQAYLGNSLPQIAKEKAGIIKSGVPVVTGVTQPEALQVIEEVAREKKSTVYRFGKEFGIEVQKAQEEEQIFHFHGPFKTMLNVSISLAGEYQLQNAAVALMTLEVLRQYMAYVFEEEDFYGGLKATKWPGRLERLSDSPQLVVDGAHNGQAAESLAQSVKQYYSYRHLHLVMGLLRDKPIAEVMRPLIPLADRLTLTEPADARRAKAADLAVVAKGLRPELSPVVIPDWQEALSQAFEDAEPDDFILVTGSLYLVGDVRKKLAEKANAS